MVPYFLYLVVIENEKDTHTFMWKLFFGKFNAIKIYVYSRVNKCLPWTNFSLKLDQWF